jgi:hypothetical protein
MQTKELNAVLAEVMIAERQLRRCVLDFSGLVVQICPREARKPSMYEGFAW